MLFARLGMGTRLFIAFLAITAVSLSSGVGSWFVLREISDAQRRMNLEALPAVAATTRTADATARLVATSSALDAAADEITRAKVEAELGQLAVEIRKSVADASFSALDRTLVTRLSGTTDALILNLRRQSALVKERLKLSSEFTRRSEETIAAATAIVDVSETLVSNASASASAVVANLYGLIDEPTLHSQAYDALDRLIEQDIYQLDRMSELRLRSSQIGLLTNRLTRAIDTGEVREIAGGFQDHLRVVRRRIASIDDPVRQNQAENYLAVLNASVGNAPWAESLFSQRLRLIGIRAELDLLAADNRGLSANVGEIAQSMLQQSEGFARTTAAYTTEAARTGLYSLVVSTLIAVVISGLIVWLYVERKVVRRLGNMAGAMQRLTDGDLTVEVKEEGTHELRALSRAVRVFRDESEQRRSLELERERTNDELRRHRQDLKALVEERTMQLREANAKLHSEVENHAEARQQAESASRAKSEFLATMSHEIRTPMTGMLGMLRILSESTLTRSQHQQLAVARHSGDALLGILNSILDYSKIESGAISLDPVTFSLREALVGIVALMQPAAGEKKLTVRLDLDPALWATHVGDAGKLRQIIFNLLSNAIKFTDSGEIRISAKVVRQTAKLQQIDIAVKDAGIGISADQQQYIFESFTQTDPSITRRYGGTGLGLAISRRLAETMGGALNVSSTLGKGSIFHASLPLLVAPKQKLASVKLKSRRDGKRKKLSVLVVEDDPATRIVVQSLLEAAGHAVTLAADGYEAISVAESVPVDVVLMDISLPGMDGTQAAAALRAAALGASVPIIAMSAHVFKTEVDQYLTAGMDGYINKPLTPETLLGGIETVLARLGAQPSVSMEPPESIGPDSFGEDIIALGAATMGKVLDAAETVLPQRFAAMRACLLGGDFESIEKLAHATCSSAASAGFTRLLAAARALEASAKVGNADAIAGQIDICEQCYRRAMKCARKQVAEQA